MAAKDWGLAAQARDQARSEADSLREQLEQAKASNWANRRRADSAEGQLERERTALTQAREALKKIAADDSGCDCDHSDADCCERVGEFCPHCISEIALAALTQPTAAEEK